MTLTVMLSKGATDKVKEYVFSPVNSTRDLKIALDVANDKFSEILK